MGAIISSGRWPRWSNPGGRSFPEPLPECVPRVSAMFQSWPAHPSCRHKLLPVVRAVLCVLSLLNAVWVTCASAREPSDREEEGMRGDVLAVVTHDALLKQTDRYDRDGRVLGRLQEGVETQEERRPGHRRDHPVLGAGLGPRADARRAGAEPLNAEVAVGEGGKHPAERLRPENGRA